MSLPFQYTRTSRCSTLALVLVGASACADAGVSPTRLEPDRSSASASPTPGVINYDSRNLAEYQTKWSNIFGPLELTAGGTRSQDANGTFTISAVPFHVGADFSVYDHLKYIAVSNQAFAVPAAGSLEFSVWIDAHTPGTVPGRVIRGCYGAGYSYLNVGDPCAKPWSAAALEGQQAGVVLNMINFATGQLFDWFISEHEAFALIERLPSNVTGSGTVGLERAYTQIIKSTPVDSKKKHLVSIRYSRGPGLSRVEYFLDNKSFATVDKVGTPLDVQGVPYTGVYPSYGAGEALAPSLGSFQLGHGLFSLLDAFPFQHPDRPDLSVSIPISERLFGQGAIGTFKDFKVITR
ncbi:hypothetical protein BH11GEM2_BH11GEM2_40950 [soil metagenome]